MRERMSKARASCRTHETTQKAQAITVRRSPLGESGRMHATETSAGIEPLCIASDRAVAATDRQQN
jgi:hypothetical protein